MFANLIQSCDWATDTMCGCRNVGVARRMALYRRNRGVTWTGVQSARIGLVRNRSFDCQWAVGADFTRAYLWEVQRKSKIF